MAQAYRITGSENAFPKDPALTTGVREIGQLVYVATTGLATLTKTTMAYPLTEKFDAAVDSVASVQLDGVAKMQVEIFTGITAGLPVKIGTTGTGIMLAVAGDQIIGYALKPATVNGEFIPVQLVKSSYAIS